MGKRHFCIKIAVFRISIGSLFDIKKTYLSLAFQYLNDLSLTNLKRLSLSASYFLQETRKCSSSSITLHTEHYIYHSVKITCVTHVFEFVSRI